MKSIQQILIRANFTTVLIVAVSTQVTFLLPAVAGDNKVYPGSTCLPESSDSASRLTRTGGRIFNPGSQGNVNLRCPIGRDNTTGGTPNSFIDVTGNVQIESCTLNTYRVNGTLITRNQDNDNRFTDVGNGIRRIDIRNANQESQGAYEIQCQLPPGASFVRYSLAE